MAIAVDIDKNALEMAKYSGDQNVHFIRANVTDLPFSNSKFDLVIDKGYNFKLL